MNHGKLSGIKPLWRSVMLMAVLFFPCYADPELLTPPDSGCIKWRDSLVVAGIRSLDSGRITDARRYFAGAFKCGMRKDSMHYYIAELYLRQMTLDTALVFNQAVEHAKTFPRELWTIQRAKIYWLIGRKKQADSLMISLQKKERHDFSFALSATRSMMTLNKFIFVPQHMPFSLESDIDDAGGANLYYRYSHQTARNKLPWFIQFTANSFLPVPSDYFIDETNDTLFKICGLAAGIGIAAVSPELTAGIRFRVHPKGKTDRYPNISLTFPISKKSLIMVNHYEKWVDPTILDDYRTDLSYLSFFSCKKTKNSFLFSIAHHFSRSDIYQNRLDSSGIYRPLPTAFIAMDSAALASGPKMYYFKDAACTQAFGRTLGDEWNLQPSMHFITAPEYDINTSLKYSFTHVLPYTATFTFSGFLQGIYYPKKITWYSTDKTIFSLPTPDRIFNDYAMVLNIVDNTYYLVASKTLSNFDPNNLLELHYHEKTRLDGFLLVSSTIEKHFGVFGDFSFTVSFVKGFSTLGEFDPMVTFNHAWEFSAGWKKDITILK